MLKVQADSRLWRLLMADDCRINSLHNQAIDRVGEGLVVSGRDLDGIVKAVEDPHKAFLVGLQWHPEFLLFFRRQRLLFQALIQAASRPQT